MSTLATLAAGAVLGVRHALEADHIAAVTSLITEDDRTGRSGVIGAWWGGVGHSVPILVIGLAFVALGIRIPETITREFEVIVGLLVAVLGVRMLWHATRQISVEMYEHDHDDHSHSHLQIGSVSLGEFHVYFRGDFFLVGVVPGLAGSGALVITMVSTALTFLPFSALSIVTMAVVSVVWSRSLDTNVAHYLQGVAGLVGITVVLVLEQIPALP